MHALLRTAVFASAVAVLTAATPAMAQDDGCRTVNVVSVRQPRVELFDTQGTPITWVSRRQLGAVTIARDCASTPAFLGIVMQGQRWLVRRSALELEAVQLQGPACTEEEYQSQQRRNASSSGVGGAGCQRVRE